MPARDAFDFGSSRVFAEQALAVAPVDPPEPLDLRHRLKLSEAARNDRFEHELRYLWKLFVPTPDQEELGREVHRYIRRAHFGLPGPHDSLYVLGRSGVGKSTTVFAAVAAHHRARLRAEGLDGEVDPRWQSAGFVSDFVPAVFVTLRADATNLAVVQQIADFLGYRARTASGTSDQLMRWARRHGIGVVVSDDVKNIADQGKKRDSIHNLLKNINTDFGMSNVASIYIGIPDASGVGNLIANDQLDQRLDNFWLTDADFHVDAEEETSDNLQWADYLDRWETALAPLLPDQEPGHLASTLGRRLWLRTQGSVGGLANLLKKATEGLLEESRPQQLALTREHIMRTRMASRFTEAVRR